jgi:high affinity Mn2+ porin
MNATIRHVLACLALFAGANGCYISSALAQQTAPAASSVDDSNYHPGQHSGMAYELGFQATLIDQNLFAFRSPYSGVNSLRARNENEKSDTYTLYAGVRLRKGIEFYVNPEMARGNGIGEALGLAGYTNGDVIRNPALGMEPYLGRYFARFTLATGHGNEKVAEGENQVASTRPTHRLVASVGKLATSDIFDINSYANSTRTQFMNWSLINNGAYDYAADTRGYSQGMAIEWVNPGFAVRIGRFAMPFVANGPDLAQNLTKTYGDQVEVETHPRLCPKLDPAIVRTLAYRNVADMGSYAFALASAGGGVPSIIATRAPGRVKFGYGLNMEQPLGDAGATGLFSRLGWNNGTTETFAYTEVDRTFGLGGQISGARWKRSADKAAMAFVQNDLSAIHRSYLAAGGTGFLLGDGRLNYGPERIFEAYYTRQINRQIGCTLDWQTIWNPGYNADRGPVNVLSFRVHLEL